MKRRRMSGVKGFVKSRLHRLRTRAFTVPHTIDTVAGVATYVKTEVEDRYGRWNDDYWTRDGYYVIHEGKRHHVYKVPVRLRE